MITELPNCKPLVLGLSIVLTLTQIQYADNYVFMVFELLYGAKCPNVSPWNDPPDSQLEFHPYQSAALTREGCVKWPI